MHPVLRQSLPVIHYPANSTGELKFIALPAVGLQAKHVTQATAEYVPQWPILTSSENEADDH